VLSMESGETVADLNIVAESGGLLNPLALSNDGSLAAVAEQNGRLTLWHVATGNMLLELSGDTRDSTVASIAVTISSPAVGPALAYDASRVALLDDQAGAWTILTLDPNDWLANGFTISDEELLANGLDAAPAC